ncbi:MAG TPA: hypothetical protein DF427_07325 [Moraxellaceae bacterium]|nr:hypothetical protein [Moraxellaceae bacterium]
MSELFNVVFSGEVSGRADPAVVRANVGKLFNASEAVLDKLFSGQPVAVKKMVDRATAMKVRAMMKQAGAETRMVPVDDQGRPLDAGGATTVAPAAQTPAAAPVARPVPAAAPVSAPAPTPAPAAPAAAPKPAAESMAERVKRMAEEQLRQEAAQAAVAKAAEAQGNWGVAPAGTRLSPVDAGPPPVAPDISGIVLAPAGSDVIAPNEKPHIPPVQVDISAINLAPAGTEVLKEDEREQVVPVVVDLSGISVAEVGAPLDEIKEEKALINPDISYLKLAE